MKLATLTWGDVRRCVFFDLYTLLILYQVNARFVPRWFRSTIRLFERDSTLAEPEEMQVSLRGVLVSLDLPPFTSK